jgi:GTP-binding protein HflX
VLVHVLDVTHPNAREHMTTVSDVLEELGVDDKPVVVALNKVDRCGYADVPTIEELIESLAIPHPVVPISANQKLGFDELRAAITRALEAERGIAEVVVHIPYAESVLVERFYRVAKVTSLEHDETGTLLTGKVSQRDLEPFRAYVQVKPAKSMPARASGGRSQPESAA